MSQRRAMVPPFRERRHTGPSGPGDPGGALHGRDGAHERGGQHGAAGGGRAEGPDRPNARPAAAAQQDHAVGAAPAGRAVPGTLSALAAVVAYLPTQELGLREGFWGAITALAVAQAELGAARSTGRDQLAGATIGGEVGWGALVALGLVWLRERVTRR
ncbi:hypothetical protein ACFQX4_16350 [Roseomonas sp. GCM10028921]